MLALKELQEDNYESIDDRSDRLMIWRNDTISNSTICDYLSVKGLSHSGTNWLKYILTLTQKEICDSPKLNQSISLCAVGNKKAASHIGQWHKSSMTDITDEIDVTQRNKEYIQIQRLMKRYPNIRFCQFIVLRDPRDAIISSIYWKNYKTYFKFPKSKHQSQTRISKDVTGELNRGIDITDRHTTEISEFAINNWVYQNFIENIKTLNEYWDYYKMKEDLTPQLYFTYFYADLIQNPQSVIKNMLIYIGVYPDVISDYEIGNIVSEIVFDKTVENGIWNLQRNGKYCDFENKQNKLLDDTVDFMNTDMTQNMIRDLLYKFNRNCAVTTQQ